jgi:hypothetical protein
MPLFWCESNGERSQEAGPDLLKFRVSIIFRSQLSDVMRLPREVSKVAPELAQITYFPVYYGESTPQLLSI